MTHMLDQDGKLDFAAFKSLTKEQRLAVATQISEAMSAIERERILAVAAKFTEFMREQGEEGDTWDIQAVAKAVKESAPRQTYRNPATGDTWVSGSKGRKPGWVTKVGVLVS